jgi:hypothetical protein
MKRSSAAVQETLRVRRGLRRSSARQAPMSCWRRGGGGGGAPDDGSSRSGGEVSGSSRSDRVVHGSSASGKGRDPGSGSGSGSGSSSSLVGGGSIGEEEEEARVGLRGACLPGSDANRVWGLIGGCGIGWLAARGGGDR